MRTTVALLLFGLLPAMAWAEFEPIFDPDGTPTEKFKKQIDALGGPKLLRGANLIGATKQGDGDWQLLEEDACITMRFHINKEGVMDRYIVLDAQPEKLLEKSVVIALANWRFSKSEQGYWYVLPFSWAVQPAVNPFGSDTRLAKAQTQSRFNAASSARCAVPVVEFTSVLPPKTAIPEDPELPLMPATAIKARQQGCATLSYRILPDGSTADFEMLDAKPADLFVTASAVAVSHWRFAVGQSGIERRGFTRFDFGIDKRPENAGCMEPKFAANHYQPEGDSP